MEDSKARLLNSVWPAFLFVLVIWCIHLLQYLFHWDFGRFGVFPRSADGLIGILTTPLVHGSISHLIHNSVPFLILGSIIFYFYPKVALRSILMIYILSGIGVWIFGRSVYHIGASGVVFGMMAFLLGTGIFRRNVKSITLALIVFFFYSGMLTGLFPLENGVSYEGHISGAVVGLFTAYFYKMEIEEDEVEAPKEKVLPESLRPYFLPRDIFDKTRRQRQWEAQEAARMEALRRAKEEGEEPIV